MMDNSLKECLFCGSFSIDLRDLKSELTGCIFYYTVCRDCGASSGNKSSRKAACLAWNTRKTTLTDRDIQAYYYAKHGALLTSKPVPGMDKRASDPELIEFYGGKYLIAESLTLELAIKICDAFGIRFCGHIRKYKQERQTIPLLENKYPGILSDRQAGFIDCISMNRKRLILLFTELGGLYGETWDNAAARFRENGEINKACLVERMTFRWRYAL